MPSYFKKSEDDEPVLTHQTEGRADVVPEKKPSVSKTKTSAKKAESNKPKKDGD